MSRYVIGLDQGRPGGDKTVRVVFDTVKRKIVSLEEWDEDTKKGKEVISLAKGKKTKGP